MATRHSEWLDSAFTWVRSRVTDAADSVLPAPIPGPKVPFAPSSTDNGTAVLEPGAWVGGLRLDRALATGGSGARIFAAIDPASGKTFAVKAFCWRSMTPGAQEAGARFLHECQVAASLRHPDIVRVYRSGVENERAFLVMELLSGSNLARYTKPARLLPEPMVMRIAARVAGSLAYAHAHGVIHRDIKSANVMFDAGHDRVTITDFGIASLAHAERPQGQRSAVIGSPATMAPEQLTDGLVDGRADLYALGVLVYQLLTGRLPHQGRTIPQLVDAIVNGRMVRMSSRRPDLPVQLCQLVDRLLDKSPSRRPDNADLVARAFQALVSQSASAEPARG